MRYHVEYRTVSGKFFQKQFANKEEYEAAKSDFQRSKRQGVDQWTETTEDGEELTVMVAMENVEAMIFLVREDEPEAEDTTEDTSEA